MRVQRQQDTEKLEELKMTLPFYIVKYLEHIGVNMTSTSALSYTYNIIDFLEWLRESGLSSAKKNTDITLEELNDLYTEDFDSYRNHLQTRKNSKYHGRKFYKTKNSNTTISNKMSALKSLFRYLSKNKMRGSKSTYISQNPLLDYEVRIKTNDKDTAKRISMSILQEEEMFQFIDFVLFEYGNIEDLNKVAIALWERNRSRDAAIICLLLHSGLRVSELVSIRLKDLNLDESYVLVERKGYENLVQVYFSDEAAELLEDYLEIRETRYRAENFENSPLFVTPRRTGPAKILTKNAIQKMVMKYASAYGKPNLTVHDLRHSFATFLLKETGNIRVVQETLGHSNIKTTQKYTHILNDEKRENVRQAFKKRH